MTYERLQTTEKRQEKKHIFSSAIIEPETAFFFNDEEENRRAFSFTEVKRHAMLTMNILEFFLLLLHATL